MQGHFSAVSSLSLAPDGWSLVSGGRDKVVHVWDLRKNTKLVTVPVYEAVEGEPPPATEGLQFMMLKPFVHVWNLCNKTKLVTVPVYEAVEGESTSATEDLQFMVLRPFALYALHICIQAKECS